MNDIIYVDLNSCFASIEQQARPMLRNRPVAVVNRVSPNACIVAASYEAKALGVKVGMRRQEALTIAPQLIFTETEPQKYIYVHNQLRQIMESYSSHVTMKSIDEGVIDLAYAPAAIRARPREELGQEIKTRLYQEVGDYMRCNIGIASNRFLAKLAAELHKPNGLDQITADNQRAIFAQLKLTDLPGINTQNQKRLNAVGIFTPLDFLDAEETTLVKLVFKSIDGSKWYQRLRGIEVDDLSSEIKSIGRQYVLESPRLSAEEIAARVKHLAEDLGHRLRSKQLHARGLYFWCSTYDEQFLHTSRILPDAFTSDQEIRSLATQLAQPILAEHATKIRCVGLTLYKLQDFESPQLLLDQTTVRKVQQTSSAIDAINNRFGSRTIHYADTLNTRQVNTKIPFGSTRYLDHAIGR